MDEFERALARGLRDESAARGVAFAVPVRRGLSLARWCAALAVLAAACLVLSLAYAMASQVLPPAANVLGALMWTPIGAVGLIVLMVAREALRALR